MRRTSWPVGRGSELRRRANSPRGRCSTTSLARATAGNGNGNRAPGCTLRLALPLTHRRLELVEGELRLAALVEAPAVGREVVDREPHRQRDAPTGAERREARREHVGLVLLAVVGPPAE